jgi:hypothetical protein
VSGPQASVLYVVKADKGDYEDRRDWIAFATFDKGEAARRAKAMKLLTEKQNTARWDWMNGFQAFVRSFPGPEVHPHQREYQRRLLAWNTEHPEPPVPEADDYEVVAVPMDQWGKWDALETPPA